MSEQIRIEITPNGEIHAKTIGMDDESCLDLVPILEDLLDAETVSSEFTEEFLRAQIHGKTEVQADVQRKKQQITDERNS